jgi:hypothetical protein
MRLCRSHCVSHESGASAARGIRLTAIAGLVLSASLSFSAAWADGPHHPGRYVPPAAGYILDPTETPVTLQFDSVPLATVQKQLNAARTANANSPIVLTLTGSYLVFNAPLDLPSKTSLVLYGTIAAAPGAKATSLISISGQNKVAIAGGVLEGNFAELSGIDAEASTQINIDAVTVRHTGRDGIVLSGNGNTVFNSGSAITRCDISQSRGNGITVSAITQALLLDNYAHENKGTGIEIGSANTSVVNNSADGNNTGILSEGDNNLISDNEANSNETAGIQLAAGSSNTALLRNAVLHNRSVGVDFDGTNNLLYNNTLSNNTDLADRSAANWVVAHNVPLQATTSQYFYPPTITNQHTEQIRNGLGRTDITVTSSDVVAVQQIYNTAVQQNPNNFIVLHMNGDFTVTTAPLTLSSNTAVLLTGTIHVTANIVNAINTSNPASFVSISGGTIDLAGHAIEAVYFPAANMAHIDQLTVLNGGVRDTRTSKSMIHLSSTGAYNILYRNTVNESGGRCLWTQNSNSREVVLENQLSNCNMDAVDFDSSTSNSYAIDNMGIDNLRYGVFVEQSDSYNKVYGNYTSTSDITPLTGHGVGVYNNATSSSTRGITNGNTIFSNTSNLIANGLRVGSIATATGGVAETANTYLFNNIVENTHGNGILFDTQFPRSVDNYFSQTVFSNNTTNLDAIQSNGATPPDFFNPMSATDLALSQPVTASSSAAGSDPANAVDGLSFTGWSPNGERDAFLTVDLGSAVSFQRIALKSANQRSQFELIQLQTSADGVHFSTIPGAFELTGLLPDPQSSETIRTFRFHPVSARYVRVNILGLFGTGIDLRELGVYPQ